MGVVLGCNELILWCVLVLGCNGVGVWKIGVVIVIILVGLFGWLW